MLIQIGLPNVEIVPSSFAEDIPKYGLSPFEYVLQTATAKALAVYRSELEAAAASRNTTGAPRKSDPDLVIAADTVVVAASGEILEKPRSEKQHVEMLQNLRDGGKVKKVEQEGIKAALIDGGAFGSLGLGAGMRGEGAVMTNGNKARKEAGSWHKVYTAIAVMAPLESARDPGYALETHVEETGVLFDPSGMIDS